MNMHEEYHELMNRMETSLQVVETLGFVFDGTMIIIPVDRLGQWPSIPVACLHKLQLQGAHYQLVPVSAKTGKWFQPISHAYA
jgi:hypothetical protein